MACPATRINEFPNEPLIVSFGKLFCSVCWETLAVKKSTVLNHINSSKHLVSKEKLKCKNGSLCPSNSMIHLDVIESDTICDAHRVYRTKVLMSFMRAKNPFQN